MDEREKRALLASIIVIAMFSSYYFFAFGWLTVASYIFACIMGYRLILEEPYRTIYWAVAISFGAVAIKLVLDVLPYFQKGKWSSWIIIIFFLLVAGWFYYHSRRLKKM